MRIIHTSDWHIGRSLAEYSMLENQKYVISNLIQAMQAEKIDVLLISGDVYDRTMPSAQSFQMLSELLEQIVLQSKIKVIMIAGNHDSPQRLSYMGGILEQMGLYVEGLFAGVLKKIVLHDDYGPLNFWLLPFFTLNQAKEYYPHILNQDDALIEIISHSFVDFQQRNVLLAHGYFSPSPPKSGEEKTLGGADLISSVPLEKFDYVALGHVHSGYKLDKQHIRYSGSIIKNAIDEEHDRKSVVFADIQTKGNLEIKFWDIKPLYDVRTVTGTFNQLIDPQTHLNSSTDDYIYVKITNDEIILNAISQLRVMFPNILGLEFKINEAKENISLGQIEKISETQLFAEFYRKIKGHEINKDEEIIIKQLVGEINDTD